MPLWTEEICRAAGLPTDVREKARRIRRLLDAYGVEADVAFVSTTTRRLRQYLDHQAALVAAGSEWEVRSAHRGVLDAMSDEIGWVERHAAELVGREPTR